MRSRFLTAASSVVGAGLALASMVSVADTMTYLGTQAPKNPLVFNPTPPALTPTIVTPMAQFSTAVSTLGRNEFENGIAAGSGNFAYTGGTATLTGGSIVGAALSNPALGRYNMTTGVPVDPALGGAYGHWLEASSDFTYTFSQAVTALSFFATDLGDMRGRFTLSLYSGSTLLYDSGNIVNAAVDAQGRGNGNLLYLGVTTDVGFDRAVFSVTQASGSSSLDWLGFDSIVVGNRVADLPEPGSLALVGLALAAAGGALRKRKAA